MKKIYFVLFLLIGLSAMAVAQHNCPFNVEFQTFDATCFNNGRVVFTLYDDDHNVMDLSTISSTTEIIQVRAYWKHNDGADTNHYAPDNVNEMTVEPGNYIVGVQAVCSDSIILEKTDTVVVGSTYVIPSASPLTNFASSKTGYGNRYSTKCVNLGRIQLKIEGGVMPYKVVMVNAQTGDTLSDITYSAPMYTGTDSARYDFHKYYTYDSLAIGSYYFYMSDACGYGLPRISERVHNVAAPTVSSSFKHVDNVDYTATATSLDKAFFPSDTVLQMRMYLDGLIPYLGDVYSDALSYRISYSAASHLPATEWRPFPYLSDRNWAVVSDTMHSGNYSPLFGNKVTLSIRYKCGTDSVIKTRDFTFEKPSSSWFDARKNDIFDSVYRENPPCASEYYMHTDFYSINSTTGWIRPINEMKPLVWIYTNTADNDVIKRDTLSNNNINAMSKLTADDIVAHFGVFDSLHQYPMKVERKLVNRYGIVLYSRVDSLKFVVSKGVEQVEWEAKKVAGSGNCGANSSITLQEKYASTTNQNQNVIRLVKSPYNNYFNFTATYDSVSGRWQVEPEDLQDITGMEVFKGTGARKLFVRGNLPSGPYWFDIETQCGTYHVKQNLTFNDQYDVRLTQEFKYTTAQHCSDLYLKPQQGHFSLYRINGNATTGERREWTDNIYRGFQIISGPRGGYETRSINTNSHDSLRITMPGTYVIRMGTNNSWCGKAAYQLDTIVFENKMIDFDYARAILCNAGDDHGSVHVKGKNGTAPFTYTLYSGPELTGVQLGSNTTGEFDNVPFTLGSTLSCQVRDNCGAFFSVDITPSQRENIKGAWFAGLKLKDVKCEGDSVTLHAFKEGTFDYEWTGPNGFTCYSADTTFALKRNDQGGWYKVSIAMGCPVPIVDSVYLDVLHSPTLAIERDTTLCPGTPFTLQLTPSSDSTLATINYKVAVFENGSLQEYSLSNLCDSTGELTITPMYPAKVFSTLIDDGTCVYRIADDTVMVNTITSVVSACNIVTEDQRVCYNTAAEMRAMSTLTPPYVLKWFSDYALTDLLKIDTMTMAGEWSVFDTNHVKANSTLFVAVEKDGMCPYVNGIPSSTVLMANGGNTFVDCDKTIHFFDEGGAAGNYVVHAGQRISHTFECAPGHKITLKLDELDIASTASLKIYTGDTVNADSLLRTLRQGADISTTLTSNGNAMTVEFITGGGYAKRGWDARIGVAAVANIDVIFRAPQLALATTNDTVCYDNTAHLTASSDLNYPQYYEWWDNQLSAILLRDTVTAPGEVSHFRPEHQIKDSLYYINVYDADYCPLDTFYFNVHRFAQPAVRMNSTTTSPIRTTVLQPYDSVPFFDLGGPNYNINNPTSGNVTTNNTNYYETFKAAEGQVVLHIDTIAIGNTSGNPFIVYDGVNTSAERLATVYNNSGNLTYTSSTGALCIQWRSKSATRGWEGYVTTNRTFADLSSAEVKIRKPLGLQHITANNDTVCYDNTAHLTVMSDLETPIFVNWYDSTLTTILHRDTIENPGDVAHFDPEHQRYDRLYYISYYNDNNCPVPTLGVEGNKGKTAPLFFNAAQNGKTTMVAQDSIVPFYDEAGPNYNYMTNNTNWVHHFKAENGDQLIMTFNSFSSHDQFDYLMFFDGPDTLSPVIPVVWLWGVNNKMYGNLDSYINNLEDLIVISSGSDLTVKWKTNNANWSQGWDAIVKTAHNEYPYSRVTVEKPLGPKDFYVSNDTVCYDYTAYLSAFVKGDQPKYYTWWDKTQKLILQTDTLTTDTSHFQPAHQVSDSIYYVTVQTAGTCPYHPSLYNHSRVLKPEVLLDEAHQGNLILVEATDSIPFYDMGGKDGDTYYINSEMWLDFKPVEDNRAVVLHIDTLNLATGEAFHVWKIYPNGDDEDCAFVEFDGSITLVDTTIMMPGTFEIYYTTGSSSTRGKGWSGHIYTVPIPMDLSEAKVKMKAPLEAKYITPVNDSVCYDYTASLSAISPIAYPQYYSWWDIDATTLLHRDTVYDASQQPEFRPEHQITDTMYYVHVNNDVTCPYLPWLHRTRQFFEIYDATLLNQLSTSPDTVHLSCGEWFPFYDEGGASGKTVTNKKMLKKVIIADDGKPIKIHIDTLSLAGSSTYALKFIEKLPPCGRTEMLMGSGVHNRTYVFTTGKVEVEMYSLTGYMGWEGYITVDCDTSTVLAETTVQIRKPYGSKNVVTTYDTVCYDNTAHLTATGTLDYPQYYQWWSSDRQTLLARDTVNAGEVSDFYPEHQKRDEIYYVSTYNADECPLDLRQYGYGKVVQPEFDWDFPITSATTKDTLYLGENDLIPFYDQGGVYGGHTSSSSLSRNLYVKAPEGQQVVLHIDTFNLPTATYMNVYDSSNILLSHIQGEMHDTTIVSSKGSLSLYLYNGASGLNYLGWEGYLTTTFENIDLVEAKVRIHRPSSDMMATATHDTVCYDQTAHLSAFISTDSVALPQYFTWWDKSQMQVLHQDTVSATGERSLYNPEHQQKDETYYVSVYTDGQCPYTAEQRFLDYKVLPPLYMKQGLTAVNAMHYDLQPGELIPFYDIGGPNDTIHRIGAVISAVSIQAPDGYNIILHIDTMNMPLSANIAMSGLNIYDTVANLFNRRVASLYGILSDTTIVIHKEQMFMRMQINSAIGTMGWSGYITLDKAVDNIAKSTVTIHRPLDATYITSTNDTVCYDNTAQLSATSSIGYPQYYTWWDDKATTLLHSDTVYDDTQHSLWTPEHQIMDSLYFVHVYNDTTCPWRPDGYQVANMKELETRMTTKTGDTVRLTYGERVYFYDDGGKYGYTDNMDTMYKVFIAEPGTQVKLHFDTAALGGTLNLYDGTSTSDRYLYGTSTASYFTNRTYYSTSGALCVRWIPTSRAMGWSAYAELLGPESIDLAESMVKIRKPLTADYVTAANDTVCYDQTATLTATSSIGFPQYYEWFMNDTVTSVYRDTIASATEQAAFLAEHQIMDSLYFVHVHNDTTCPYLPGIHHPFGVEMPETRLDNTIPDTVDIACGETYPFYDRGGATGTTTSTIYTTYRKIFRAEPGQQVILHIDTLSLYNNATYALNVYDGASESGTLLQNLYGTGKRDITCTSTTGMLFVSARYTSNNFGWNATVTTDCDGNLLAPSTVKVIPVPATVTIADHTLCPNVHDTVLTAVFTDVTPTYTAVWVSEGDTLAVHKDIPDTQLTDTIHFTAPAGTMCGDVMKYNVICVASTGCETVSDTNLLTFEVTDDFTVPADRDSVVACLSMALEPGATQLPAVTDACGNILTPAAPTVADSIPTDCEGKRTYTYTYTDCASRNHKWTYTYWVRLPKTLKGVPANDTLAVMSISDAVAPGAPDITDSCGRTITPTYDASVDSVSTSSGGSQTISHTYHYADCAGNDSTYTRVYRLSVVSTLLEIASSNCEWAYTGVDSTCEEYTVTFGGTVVDECVSCSTPGSHTHRYILPGTGDTVTISDAIVLRDVVTDTANTCKVVIDNAARYTNVTLDTGKVTITPRQIEITASDSTKECDGTALTDSRWSLTTGTLGAGDTITSVTVTGSQDGVGSSNNVPSAAVIMKGSENVTHNYGITYKNGTLTVTDTTKPLFTRPVDTTLYKNDLCQVDTTAAAAGAPTGLSDNCASASSLTVTHTDGGFSSSCAGSFTFVRTWRVTDGEGNYSEQQQTIEVSDTTKPVFTAPADTILYKDAFCNADTTTASTGVPVVTDNCTGKPIVTYVDQNFKAICAHGYSFDRVWTVSDSCGNTAAPLTQHILVTDTTKPTFTVPADTIICRDVADQMILHPDVAVTGEPTGHSDNCTDAATLLANTSYTDDAPTGTDDEVRYVLRHWTVTDACGNTTEKIQRIGVFPAIHAGNTTLTCPAPVTVMLAYGRCDTALSIGTASMVTTVTGSPVRISNNAPADGRYAPDTTVVTWTATDTCGNTVSCDQLVIVTYPPCGPGYEVTYDGYVYPTVRVGCDCWLKENLRNTVYSDGTDVASYSSYEHSAQNEADFGMLYSWYSTMKIPEYDDQARPTILTSPMGDPYIQGICPEGWAVPTSEQYDRLWLNGYGTEGIKDMNTRYWLPGLEGTLPNCGFNARGAGYYDGSVDRYYNLLGETYFWTGDPVTTVTEGHCSVITMTCPQMLHTVYPKGHGHSVRCIQMR